MVAFTLLVIEADQANTVFAVIEPVLVTVQRTHQRHGQFPYNGLNDAAIRKVLFLSIISVALRFVMVSYAIILIASR